VAERKVSPIPDEQIVKVARGRRRQRGQSLVEFALILPIFMILFLGVVEFGWALRAYVVEQNAAREGARYWALNGNPGSCDPIGTAVTNKAPTLSGMSTSYKIGPTTTTTCAATSPNDVTVTATYTYNFITPLGGFLSGVAGPLTMNSSATMRVE
jgi:Flp pilus assembly protein TadG